MYDLKNGDLVITTKAIKKKILNYFYENKILINVKILTLQEFKNNYFGSYDERAIYFVMKKYGYNYENAKKNLDNFYFNNELKKELLNNNLLNINNLFKKRLNTIKVINIKFLDSYIKKELDKYNTKYYYEKAKKNIDIYVREFKFIDEEIVYVFNSIIDLLKNVPISNIFLVNVSSEYIEPIKRLSKIYNIPINIGTDKKVYSNILVQKFIETLKNTKNISESIKVINDNNIYNAILSICNKYAFSDVDDIVIDCIIGEIKNTKVSAKSNRLGIDVIEIDDICNEDNYYYILGFNEGILPKVHKDEDFISDSKKIELGILTSKEKNNLDKEMVLIKITNYSNVYISYKQKTNFSSYYPSSIIAECNISVIKENKIEYKYSNLYNKIKLASMLDNLIKYNELDKDISILYYNYNDIEYKKYDNKFNSIDKNDFLNYIGDNLLLSYSSIDNYNRCGFKYYIKNILKLDDNNEKFSIYVGNLYHYILSKAFESEFDFENEFNNYISSKTFTPMEYFFILKLKTNLKFVIETIKNQNSYISLKNELYEKKICVDIHNDIKVTFMGIIDKIKYDIIDDKKIIALVDYKTGSPDIDLNDIVYGLNMQLPIYLYLINNSEFKDYNIAGFYIQKIIPSIPVFDINKNYEEEKIKSLRLEGYSNSDLDILKSFDSSYDNSFIIKGMKTTSKGFYAYSKVLDEKQISNLLKIVKANIEKSIDNILSAKFDINPKQIDFSLKGCEYCEYKDLCFRTENDIVKLKSQNIDLTGGENDD